jgi:hypothetical protein
VVSGVGLVEQRAAGAAQRDRRRVARAVHGVPAGRGERRERRTALFYDGNAGGGTRRAELDGVRWRRRWRICEKSDSMVGPTTARRGGRLDGVQGWRSSAGEAEVSDG